MTVTSRAATTYVRKASATGKWGEIVILAKERLQQFSCFKEVHERLSKTAKNKCRGYLDVHEAF